MSSRWSEPVVLPGHDLSVNSSSNPLFTLLALLVEMTMAVEVRRGDSLGVTLLLAGIEVVDGKLLELEGASNVNRKLVVSY